MEIIPAIDLRDGKCVRLYQGDYNQQTVFSDDPVAVALNWKSQGAGRIHIVDLDGAASGELRNLAIIKAIIKQAGVPVQLGGGIRNEDTVKKLTDIGVNRVILGTAAIEQPDLIKGLCRKYDDSIVIGIDARDGLVATRGWLKDTGVSAVELGREMANIGVRRILYTDIKRDGTLTEPGYNAIAEMIANSGLPVIAAGGISAISHLRKLKELGAEGAILGKALYTGNINLSEALAVERDNKGAST